MSTSTTSQRRRVVITGIGVICPLGNSPEKMWEHLSTGRTGIDALQSIPKLESLIKYGGEAKQFTGQIDDFGTLRKDQKKAIRKGLKVMCRETKMAVAAAQHAISDSGYESEEALARNPDCQNSERAGVVFGSDYMLSQPQDLSNGMVHCGVRQNDFQFNRWGTDGLSQMNPLWMLKYLPNMPGSHIAIFNDLRGPNNSLTLREIAGIMAIREAAQTIQRNHADRMVAGATGTRIHPFKTIHAIFSEQLADPTLPPERAARPFDQNRTGMVIGEGAAALVLEELESARSRGATIYAEILGTGSSTVTDSNLCSQRQVALANAMRSALVNTGNLNTGRQGTNGTSLENLAASDNPRQNQIIQATAALGHLNAHGLGTQQSDVEEARAIVELFGHRSQPIPVVAVKSYFGNLGAASGIVELIASLLALREGRLFPSLNYDTPDSQCPLAVAMGNDTPAGQSFLKSSVTPQGQAAALHVGLVAA
ncbi:MAG: beta-ketoacyl-[acyl-carrier-protein] synthase family protein [Pirellulales bacterium]